LNESLVNATPPALSVVSPPIAAERLHALWRLSVQSDLSDDARIRAMLALAAEITGMELVVLGEFHEGYQVRYAHDALGLVAEGSEVDLDSVLCRDIVLTGRPKRHDDLTANPDFVAHPLVGVHGMRVYYGVPVHVRGEADWAVAFLRRGVAPTLSETDIAFMALVADWLGNALYQSARARHLTELALTDALTGLPNRRAAEESLARERARIGRDGGEFGLALIDIDHFKDINDRYGHAVGDEVLRGVAGRFGKGLRQGDWVARWGGEEFLFFLHGSNSDATSATLQRIASELDAHPLATSIGPVPLTFSAGVDSGQLPMRGDIDESLERLDATLYQCKANGRNQVRCASDNAPRWSATELKRSLDQGRVRTATQSIIHLASGQIFGDEALARLQTEDGEMLDAGVFIDQAESMGLIAELDRQVIHATMRRCVSYLADGGSPAFSHFVNVSPHFMARPDLVAEMLTNAHLYCKQCVVEMGALQTKPVVLELTERQRVVDLKKLRADLQPFIDFGYRLALDDFGSGYSSYLYVANLPVSFIKIEGWLVANMLRDQRAAHIVESLAGFAHKEGLETIAEHVEDAATAARLRDIGVTYGQGYFFGRPQLVQT
jgi:diguanylate cyclase (GGDEF)-like protein